MRNTLAECLEAIFGAAATPTAEAPTTPTSTPIPPNLSSLIQAALDAYEASQTALSQGDWPAYGEAQQDLERILQELDQIQLP